MIDLLQITNNPAMARRCDALAGMRVFLDLERLGKSERQAKRNTFISTHEEEDIAPVKAVLTRTKLMVRVNPLNPDTPREVGAVIARGADMVMLPMFSTADELHQFSAIVAGRVPVVPLLETARAFASIEEWIATPGIGEVFVGLNDLHISLGCRFMFEPLVLGHVERVAAVCERQGLRFGFGGIAQLDDGLLPGRDVLREHLRLGSRSVILSRTFNAGTGETGIADSFEAQVAALREAETDLSARSSTRVQADRERVHRLISEIAARSERPS